MKQSSLLFVLLFIPSVLLSQTFFNVDFSESFPPAGWTIDLHQTNWSAVTTTNSGGTAPEAQFNWSPQFSGDSRLISPAINTTGQTSMTIEFKHNLDHYGGPYTIGAATRSGGGSWNIVWSKVNPTGSIPATTEEVTINNSDVGAADFQICWFFSGNSYNLNYWYLDDLKLFVPLPHDAMVKDILVNLTYPPGSDFTPTAKLKNFGLNTETFDATCELKIGGITVYTQNCSPVTLDAGEEQDVTFPDYTLNAVNDIYEIIVTTNLAGDMEPANDSRTELFNTYTTERDMVVLEIGTGTWCTYCPGSQMGADDLITNGHSVLVVENHNGDPFTNTYSDARNVYYGISGYPTAVFDGVEYFVGGDHTLSMYQFYLPIFEGRDAIMSAFMMQIFGEHTDLDYDITLSIKKLAVIPSTWNNLVVHLTITETDIPFSWQGQTEVDYCQRLYVPNQNGTAVDFSSNNEIEVPLQFTLNPNWVIDNLEIGAFIQNLDTKEILQGSKVKLTDLMQYSSVTVQSPNGGETWVVGDNADITWQSINVNDVKIELSVNNGATWSTIVGSAPNTGSYNWAVTAQDSSDACLIRISDAVNGNTFDMSDAVFTIDMISGTGNNQNIPFEFNLSQNYPNPFNPSTIINYSVAETSPVTIKVFDVIGNEIAVLVNNELKSPGNYNVNFDASKLASGVYLYQMKAGKYISVKKMSVVK